MILAEAERLYGIGFGVHWIRENSKAPVKEGWSGPTRDKLKMVKQDYRKGLGLGVRLGYPSKLEDGYYLANIDVDIKSPGHQGKALKRLEKLYPGLFDEAPIVKTGYGYRLFVKTKAPLASIKIFTSKDQCKVRMPGTEINRRQKDAVAQGLLTEKELQNGWRIRPAYEIEFMSAGKQVVLPPSRHPETGLSYIWQRPVTDSSSIPVLASAGQKRGSESGDNLAESEEKGAGGLAAEKFKPVAYKLSGRGLSDETVMMLVDGIGVVDRSAAMFSVTMSMLRCGYSDEEIISCLTDRDNYLGEVAFEHRQTKSRANAASWVRKYCLKKAKAETSAAAAFRVEAGETPILQSKEEIKAQVKAVTGKVSLASQLEYTKQGDVKANFGNTLLILQRDAEGILGRDEFAQHDVYLKKSPWGWDKGRVAGDNDDCILIKTYLQEKYGCAPTLQTIFEVVTQLSLANSFHPIKTELESLPEWDNKNRIDTWLTKYFGANQDPLHYVADVFRKWLVMSVMRTYQPGEKMDWMPVLEGPPAGGKGEFAKIIAGHQYHIDNIPSLERAADAAIQLEGARIVEFEELSALRHSTNETIKGFISRQKDKVRRPYDRKPVHIYRQCVFIGTTNNETYLYDETGNRRYNPIRVGQLNVEQLKRDRDQLWAEALWIYQNLGGESFHLTGKSLEYAKDIQQEKMVQTDGATFEEIIFHHFNSDEADNFNYEDFSILDLFGLAGPLAAWKPDQKNMQAAATALRKLGATKRMVRGYNRRTLVNKKIPKSLKAKLRQK